MAVLGLASALAGFVKVRYLIDKAIIDNMIFRCHYKVTSAILFFCCIIVTANNLIGEPIMCLNDGAIPGHVINTYCWITYTFTMPGQHGKRVGTEVASSGLGNDNGEKIFHSYYQWVPFMLFFQGILFYLPHWIWKNWEEGKVRLISDGMRGVLTMPSQRKKEMQNRLAEYLYQTKNMHNTYAFGYFFCEALNLINVVGNIFFIDFFLGGTFLTYGTDVLRFVNENQETRSDPMVEVFPRVTKCVFHKFGASGSIQKHDALCVLALNILNEKIYIFLWFWFIILAVLSACALIYSAMVIMMPTTRESIIKRRFRDGAFIEVESLIRKIQIGDFLLLHLLGQNINVQSFTDIVRELSKYFESSSSPSAPSTIEMPELSPIYGSGDSEKETMT